MTAAFAEIEPTPELIDAISDAIAPLPTHGPGGAPIRYTVSGSWAFCAWMRHCVDKDPGFDPSDIDLYFESAGDREDFLMRVTEMPESCVAGANQRSVRIMRGSAIVDVVHARHDTCAEIALQHDLSTAGVGLLIQGGTYKSGVFTRECKRTSEDGKLRVQSDRVIENARDVASTVKRAQKYADRGYPPTAEACLDMLASVYTFQQRDGYSVVDDIDIIEHQSR